ncbi:hypothetical protein [Methanobacterium oryzae]|uniref:hypothetical protein n=1 Tax=Methanobacterium oryzae TaxID=69540 RepID=UPI003D1B4B09
MKNIYKLLLLIAVLFILITSSYASSQNLETSFDLTNQNSPEIVRQSDSESSRKEHYLVSDPETCLICNDTGTITKTITNYLACKECDGTGRIICPHCSGSGRSEFSKHLGTNICPSCQGNGRLTCPNCHGKGYKSETLKTQVNCPICKNKI